MKRTLILSVFLLFVLFVQAQVVGDTVAKSMQSYVDSGEIPGMFYLVADANKILEKGGVGYANIENKTKMEEDVLFWIASQSKPFAGTAVMILVDEDKLNLDKPVTEYLPELNHLMVRILDRDSVEVLERVKRPVTLRRLLTHTSGMQYLAGVQQQFGKIDYLPFSKSVYVSNMTPLTFEPGDNFRYSNQGIDIAAAIVERVSGMPYEDFLQKRIFDPLGMESITFWPTEKQMGKMAIPYKKVDNKLVPSTLGQLQYPLNDRTKRFAEAAGGLFCTPKDLVKFYQMIDNKGMYNGKRIMSEKAVEELGKKHNDDKTTPPWGLGWAIGPNFMGHGGALGTQSRLFKKEGLIVMYFFLGEGLPKEKEAYHTFEQTVKKMYDIQ